jgi:hypothetical protein
MKRREFITLVGGAAIAWPRGVVAQIPVKRPLIAYLAGATRSYSGIVMDALPVIFDANPKKL